MHPVLFCSTNQHKYAEYQKLFAIHGVELQRLGVDYNVPETGKTIWDNCLQKAKAYSELFPDKFIFVEDSGLVVPTLLNLPGAFSSDFCDLDLDTLTINPRTVPDKKSRASVDRLIQMLTSHGLFDWTGVCQAYYSTVGMFLTPGKTFYDAEGQTPGVIRKEAKGKNGFAYDEHFYSVESKRASWAEITTEEKNKISPRNRVVRDLIDKIIAEISQ